MNKLQRIISLENRVKELEKAIQTTVESNKPKFKAWEAYKHNVNGHVVVCIQDSDTKLKGYGIFGNKLEICDQWNAYDFTIKATPEETESMLRKACEIWGGEDWENVKIFPFAGLHTGHDNDGSLNIGIEVDKIYNRNGCIMYKGKWAKKLEVDLANHKAYYICEDIHANGFVKVLQYNGESGYYEDKLGRTWMENQLSSIEPYTPERLIELAEQF